MKLLTNINFFLMNMKFFKGNKKLFSLVEVILLTVISIFGIGIGLIFFLSALDFDGLIVGLLATQFSILILALSLFRFKIKEMLSNFKFENPIKMIGVVLGATALIMFLNMSVGLILSPLVNDGSEANSNTQTLLSNGNIMSLLIMPVILAPIFEELAFRAGFKKVLVDNGGWKNYQYVIISSAMFALLHFQPGAFALIAISLTFLIGVVNSVVYLKTKNILLTILIHMAYNGIIMYIGLN